MRASVILHTPCLQAGIFPNCDEGKGKCEVKGYVIQTTDRDHIAMACTVPSLIVAASETTGAPIRPLKIFGVAEDSALRTNHQSSGIWQECLRYKINVNGCSKNFECGKCISDSKHKTNPHKSMGVRKTTYRNLCAPLRMDTTRFKQAQKQSKEDTKKNAENNTNSGE